MGRPYTEGPARSRQKRYPQIIIRLTPEVFAEMQIRGGNQKGGRESIVRYLKLLDIGRSNLLRTLSSSEVDLILDAVGDIQFEAWSFLGIAMNVQDGAQMRNLGDSYNVDVTALVGKLNSFNPLQRAALVDVIERHRLGDCDAFIGIGVAETETVQG